MKKKMTAPQILAGVKSLFSNKDRWTQGFYAKTKTNEHCDEGSRAAICWCLMGGVNKVAGKSAMNVPARAAAVEFLSDAIYKEGFRKHRTYAGQGRVVSFNDRTGRTIGEIRRVLNRAIKLAAAAA